MYRRIAGTLAAVALVAAVASPATILAQSDAEAETIENSRIMVHVENGNWLDVRVYAVREGGAYDRIGTVTSFSSKKLALPRWMTSSSTQIQLVAVPIGSSRSYAAPPVIASAGDVIEWRLANNLVLSTVWVRAG